MSNSFLWKSKIHLNRNKYLFRKNHSRGKYKRHIAPNSKKCLSLVFFHYLFPFSCHSPVVFSFSCLVSINAFFLKPHVHTIMWLASRKHFFENVVLCNGCCCCSAIMVIDQMPQPFITFIWNGKNDKYVQEYKDWL